MQKFWDNVWDFIKMLLVAGAVIFVVRYFLAQPFYVKGASMEPTFFDNEYLIVNEIGYRFHAPQRGDIIVFRYPKDPQEYFIKRIIGLPGESVQVKDGGVYIFNTQHPEGFLLKENYLAADVQTYAASEDKVVLNDHEYYVLGDNRKASKDSRVFGAVDKSFVTGRVWVRGLPLSRAGTFPTPSY